MENIDTVSRDRMKKKIKALLAKTTDNGASESEAVNALKKASELMLEYYIEFNDLKEINENNIIKKEYIFKSGYDNYRGYIGDLGELFNTSVWSRRSKNTKIITVFGLPDDVDLTIYFIKFVQKSIELEFKKYQYSLDYVELKMFTKISERTIKSEWIKGFKDGISTKIADIYNERNRHKSYGKYEIVSANIADLIKQFIENDKFKTSKRKPTIIEIIHADIANSGKEQGESIDITQPLNSATINDILDDNLTDIDNDNLEDDELKYLE